MLAASLRWATLVAPVVVAVVAAALVVSAVRTASAPVFVTMRIVAIGVAAGTYVVVERASRRLLPLSFLLEQSLLFPDQVPSRLGVALRAGSPKRLLRPEALDADHPGEAAAAVLALAASITAHDPATRGHSERVRAYSELIADELGLDAIQHDRLRWAALLHDIGKVSVPSGTLNATHPLNEDEWAALRRHPAEGARLAAGLDQWLGTWAPAIVQHHERYDGGGYPNGLQGDELCIGARIVAVADSYDAMTTQRSYNVPLSPVAARQVVAAGSGGQFDPGIVRAFLNVGIGRLRWIAGPLAVLALLPGLRALRSTGRWAGAAMSVAVATAVVAASGPGASTAIRPPAAGGGRAGAPPALSARADPTAAAPVGHAEAVAAGLLPDGVMQSFGTTPVSRDRRDGANRPAPTEPPRPGPATPCLLDVPGTACVGASVDSAGVTVHVAALGAIDTTVEAL